MQGAQVWSGQDPTCRGAWPKKKIFSTTPHCLSAQWKLAILLGKPEVMSHGEQGGKLVRETRGKDRVNRKGEGKSIELINSLIIKISDYIVNSVKEGSSYFTSLSLTLRRTGQGTNGNLMKTYELIWIDYLLIRCWLSIITLITPYFSPPFR